MRAPVVQLAFQAAPCKNFSARRHSHRTAPRVQAAANFYRRSMPSRERSVPATKLLADQASLTIWCMVSSNTWSC